MVGLRQSLSVVLLSFAVITMLIGGCSTSNANLGKGHRAANGLTESADLIRSGRDQVSTTLGSIESLRDMQGGALADLFAEYQSNLSTLESIAGKVAATNEKMRAEGAKYFENWDQEIASIANEDIQKRSTKRLKEIQSAFGKLEKRYRKLTSTYNELITDLRDINTAMAADLTAGGVDALGKPFKRALSHGKDVIEAADDVADAYEELGLRMSSSGR